MLPQLGDPAQRWELHALRADATPHMAWSGTMLPIWAGLVAFNCAPGTRVAHHTRKLAYKLDHWCVVVFPSGQSYNVMADFDAAGAPLQIYVNIATPPRIAPPHVTWRDLYLDVIFRPGQQPLIADLDDLEQATTAGIMTTTEAADVCRAAEAICASTSPLFLLRDIWSYVATLEHLND